MKYHPDDQTEIDRLHAEFIALDEPNNEQVMAFQDASYALGLKRGQVREAALQQRLDTAEHQREQLAQAIADATHKAGIVAGGAALDGPTLLMVLNDLADCHLATQQRLKETDQRLDEMISAVRSVNRGTAQEIRLGTDDQPVYWQRKEWIDWVLELCDEVSNRQLTNPTPEAKP